MHHVLSLDYASHSHFVFRTAPYYNKTFLSFRCLPVPHIWMEVVWANRCLRVENDRCVLAFYEAIPWQTFKTFKTFSTFWGNDRRNNIPKILSFVFFLLLSPWTMHLFDGMMNLQLFGYYLRYLTSFCVVFCMYLPYLSIDLSCLCQVTDVTHLVSVPLPLNLRGDNWTMADINKSAKWRTLRQNIWKKSF